MATVSGRLLFDRARAANPPSGMAGIADVAIVLINVSTNESLAVLTDINGNYSFINVPDGDYHIVEAFGTTPAVATPGDFANAAVTGVPVAAFPPISFAPNPPAGATNLDGVSRNTIPITVTNNQNVTNQFILNGPVTYTPIEEMMDECAVLSPVNLITDAFGGTMGSFPAGTPANTSEPTEPFPQNVPDYTYVLTQPGEFVPDAQEYTVQNLLTDTQSTTIGAWWRIADHLTGNETGRMMVVNGDIPGSVIFTTTVNVLPNTTYMFSSWILNMFKVTGWANPRLGVVVLDESGREIYHQTLGALIPLNTNNPEWKQIGTAINSRDNTMLTVQFLSEGLEEIGNDYALDEISLQQIDIPLFTPVKSISTNTADVGDVVTFTVTLTNDCQSPLVNVYFADPMPDGLIFEAGTVSINGEEVYGLNPEVGFDVPDIGGGETVTVTFDAIVASLPSPNPAINSADMTYSYTPVEGGILGVYNVTSNDVSLNVNAAAGEADLSVDKTASADRVQRGETVTYTIVVVNNGPDAAEGVELWDTVPPMILNPEYSLDGGVNFQPWTRTISLGDMENLDVQTVLIRGEVSSDAVGFYVNEADVTSHTPDPDLTNNISSATIEVGPDADVAISKRASHVFITPGEVLTYTIGIVNIGPDDAENVTLTDYVPGTVTNPEFSTDGGANFNPWPGSVNFGTLTQGEMITVLLRGIVAPDTPFGLIVNTARASSTTPDPDTRNNNATVGVDVQPAADIAINKTAAPEVVNPGDTLTYTLAVNNQGPNIADSVLVTDIIASGTLLSPQFSVDGTPMGAWPGSYNLGNMNPDTSHNITITGTIAPGVTGTIFNMATVLAETSDPDLNNNSSVSNVVVESEECFVEGEQIIEVCLPVSVRPFANVGTVTTRCCGAAIITPGTNICQGTPGGDCNFTITQRICVNVPVTFGADVQPGEVHNLCTEEDCSGCDDE